VRNGLQIDRWAFWSPESQSPSAWRTHWRTNAASPKHADVPDDAIPAFHRRRMSALSKLSVQVALQATGDSRADFLVFCSQHGELIRSRELLGSIADGVELSPTAFSQSVHNTSAGLYTIISRSRAPATALASGASTFAYGWLEAEAYITENPSARVLLVSYDERVPAEYLRYSKQKPCMYAVGLMLSKGEAGHLRLERVSAGVDDELPVAPLFLAWWLTAEPSIWLTADGQGWSWSRHG
jgi:hypothetical protein